MGALLLSNAVPMNVFSDHLKFQPFRSLRLWGGAIALTSATLLGACDGGLEDRPVSELVEILQGEDESQAISAASALGSKKDPAGIDPLIAAATGNDSASVRKLSTMALKWFDDPKAMAALVKLTQENDGEVATAAKDGFENVVGQKYASVGEGMVIAKEDSPKAYDAAFAELKTILASPEEFKADSAIIVLGQTGDPRAAALLIEILKTGTDSQRQRAATALGGIDSPESVAALKEAASDGNALVAKGASQSLRELGHVDLELLKAELDKTATRDGAIATLGKMKTPESLQLLATELQDGSHTIPEKQKIVDAIATRSDLAAAKVLLDHVKAGKTAGVPERVGIFKKVGEMGKQSQDPKIVRALVDYLEATPGTLPPGAVGSVFSTMGEMAYEPTLALLSKQDPQVRQLAVLALGPIGNKEAIAPLKAELTDRTVSDKAASSLKALGWEPSSDREKVLLWLASKDKAQLTGNWETTKTVLLAEAGSGQVEAATNALYGFVAIGNDSVIPALKENLDRRGNKDLALAYLNCGQPDLEAAAQAWAKRNGYAVIKTPGATAAARWGSL